MMIFETLPQATQTRIRQILVMGDFQLAKQLYEDALYEQKQREREAANAKQVCTKD